MIKVGIVGGTGYTGVELLRLLIAHPQAKIQCITSRADAGKAVDEIFPNLRGAIDLSYVEPDLKQLGLCDLVFFATPNGIAMTMVPELLKRQTRVIDLAADFRLKDVATWERWYGMKHQCPEYIEQAVYGLPEQNRKAIQHSQLIANPGCYPTAVSLGWLPVIENGAVDIEFMVADAKSGVSGAGRKAAIPYLLAEASENMSAYGMDGHRHEPEIQQILAQAAQKHIEFTFVPHLTPMIRGMLATLYAKVDLPESEIRQLYVERYRDEPFVQILPRGQAPQTRAVRGSNTCQIAMQKKGDMLVVLSAIDNLNKGAAGQAVQNMNIMFELQEDLGLQKVGLLP